MVVLAAIIKCRQTDLFDYAIAMFSYTLYICQIMLTKLTLYVDSVLFTVLLQCVDAHVFGCVTMSRHNF